LPLASLAEVCPHAERADPAETLTLAGPSCPDSGDLAAGNGRLPAARGVLATALMPLPPAYRPAMLTLLAAAALPGMHGNHHRAWHSGDMCPIADPGWHCRLAGGVREAAARIYAQSWRSRDRRGQPGPLAPFDPRKFRPAGQGSH
jgi:hypothetical protein